MRETMLNKPLKNWLEKYDLSCLSLIDVLGAPLEMSDENGVYYIIAIYIDSDGDLSGWCNDVDGGEFEVFNISLPLVVELKILMWLFNH